MAKLKIAHISDIHFLRDYSETYHHLRHHQNMFGAQYFEASLYQALKYQPDVILLTGDLVEEGESEDYVKLRERVELLCKDTPVLIALGNHDKVEHFYKGYLGEQNNKAYFHKSIINGYRFLVLDTSTEKTANGKITSEQLAWLEEELATPSENGTFLVGHHPLKSEQIWFDTEVPEKFWDIIKNSDVIAYMCGHAHHFEVRQLSGITQITAESCIFGVESLGEDVYYNETRGFNFYYVEDKELIVNSHPSFPYSYNCYKFNINEPYVPFKK